MARSPLLSKAASRVSSRAAPLDQLSTLYATHGAVSAADQLVPQPIERTADCREQLIELAVRGTTGYGTGGWGTDVKGEKGENGFEPIGTDDRDLVTQVQINGAVGVPSLGIKSMTVTSPIWIGSGIVEQDGEGHVAMVRVWRYLETFPRHVAAAYRGFTATLPVPVDDQET